MRGKSYSIPIGMVFKKYYCHECESKLVKHKTHRIVKKDDFDYYQYQDRNTYPRIEHDVYDYHFKCEHCNKLIAVEHQYIIEIIQKMLKSKRLSESEIKENYEKANIKRKKKKLFSDIFIPILFVLMFLAIADFIMRAKGKNITIILAIIFVLTVTMIVWFELRRYKGKVTNKYYRNYRYEAKKLYNKLHTYSYNNRLLIQQSNYCYCFYCKSKIEARKIESYMDDNVTALCPNCGIDSIIPDCIEEEINDEIIDKMNKYWF